MAIFALFFAKEISEKLREWSGGWGTFAVTSARDQMKYDECVFLSW